MCSETCVVLACSRARHRSPSGRVRYNRCPAHLAEALGRAFAPDPIPLPVRPAPPADEPWTEAELRVAWGSR